MRNIAGSKRVTLFIATAFLLFFNGLLLSGCTLLGLGVGLMIDSEPGEIKCSEVDTLKPGTRMAISLPDHEKKEGRFVGTDFTLPPRYAELYDSVRRQLSQSIRLPAVGDSVVAVDIDQNRYFGEFIGFGRSQLSSTRSGLDNMLPFVFIREKDSGGVLLQRAVVATQVEDMNKIKIGHTSILSVLENPKFPIPSKWITIGGDEAISRINFQDVGAFRVDEPYAKSHYAWLTCGLIGAAFDTVIYFVLRSMHTIMSGGWLNQK